MFLFCYQCFETMSPFWGVTSYHLAETCENIILGTASRFKWYSSFLFASASLYHPSLYPTDCLPFGEKSAIVFEARKEQWKLSFRQPTSNTDQFDLQQLTIQPGLYTHFQAKLPKGRQRETKRQKPPERSILVFACYFYLISGRTLQQWKNMMPSSSYAKRMLSPCLSVNSQQAVT